MDQKELMAALTAAAETPVSHVDLSASTQRIKVDMDTRNITGHKEFGVIKDHLAENIIFEVKRYKGDTDLAEKHCAIHWENGKNGGVLPVTEVDLSEDGLILMRWELSDEFTQYKGQIAYALHFFSILDGGFTYHAATNAASGTLGDTLNASAHSKNKITPSEIEVYIAKMNELSAAMDEQVVLAQEAAAKAESIAEQLAEKTGQIDLNTQKNAQHSTEIAALTQSKSDAITVEKSGTSIVATDSSDKGFEQFRTYGGSKQEKTSGKNLLDLRNRKGGTGEGVTLTNNGDGTYKMSGTATGPAGNVWLAGDYGVVPSEDNSNVIISLEAGTYTVTDCKLFTMIGSNLKEYGGTFTISETLKVTGVRNPNFTSGETYNKTIYPMLNKGSTALPWEPYTGNIPSPNPEYPQPIVSAGQMLVDGVVTDVGIGKKLTGKNLLKNTAVSQTVNGVTFTVNNDGSVTVNGTSTANINMLIGEKVFSAGEYIGSGCPSGGSVSAYFATIYKTVDGVNSTMASLIGNDVSFTLTEEVTIKYFVRLISGTTVSNLVFKPMLRLASIEDDTYEPYTEQTLTLNRVLRGIPLGTDIPEMFKSNALHMDGIYWNEEEQQYYIADTIDAERGVLVQNIGHYKLNSSLTIALSSKHIGCIYFDASSIGGKIKAPYICTHAKWCGIYPTALAYGVGISNEFSYNLWLFESSKTVAEAKAYFDTNDVFMDYILATPIETPLTDEEIIAYKTLHSNKPTTIITNDAGCFMEVAYVADPKNHIEQNYVPVSKYTALEERVSALEQLHV